MNRKPTRQSRAANASEKRYHAWAKDQPCACCGSLSGSILDHWSGSSRKLYSGTERVMVGHWLVVPLCQECDDIKTRGNSRAFAEAFGSWLEVWTGFIIGSPEQPPENVFSAVAQEVAPRH